jgi:uncharacterized protein YjaZ
MRNTKNWEKLIKILKTKFKNIAVVQVDVSVDVSNDRLQWEMGTKSINIVLILLI